MTNSVLIIDGNNLLFRVFYTAASIEGTDQGTLHISMFLTSLKSYVELFNPSKIIVCWDHREDGEENYRKQLDEQYKAQRDSNGAATVYRYSSVIKNILDTLGVYQINPKYLEADDIIFWLTMVKYRNRSVVVTTDTDMYQLVSEVLPNNIVYNPKKKREITPVYLKEYYGVSNGVDFIVQKALRGDKADNLGGIKGLRKDKIQTIIEVLTAENNNFSTETLVKSGILKQEEADIFSHNLQLMKFSLSMISQEELDWYEECLNRTPGISKERFRTLIKELEFWKIYKKIDYWFSTFDRLDLDDIFAPFLANNA